MAWKAKTNRARRPSKWSGRRTTTADVARRLDTKLNKRYQWVPIIDILCGQAPGQCKGCCENPEEPQLGTIRGCTYSALGVVESPVPAPSGLVLVPPAPVPGSGSQALYDPDTVTIVKMVGKVEFCPVFCDSADKVALCMSDPGACAAYLEFQNRLRNYHFRAAMDKTRFTFDPVNLTYNTPLRYPMETQEWTDAQFLRQWERHRGSPDVSTFAAFNGSAPLGCCGDVTGSGGGGGSSTNILTDGSGTIDTQIDPIDISTDCQPCGGDQEDTFRSYGYTNRNMPCFTLSLNSRRRLTFKENEGLVFWWDYTSFTPDIAPAPTWRPNVSFSTRIWLKALLEVA